MRLTIELPDDIHEKVAVDALKKRRNSKALVITEILRAHYRQSRSAQGTSLRWRIPSTIAGRIEQLRHQAKTQWA